MMEADPLAALAPDTEHLAALSKRLVRRADEQGDLDVAYRTFDTPIGTLLLAATGVGLVRVAFTWSDHDALDELAQRVSPRLLQAPGRLDPVVRQLDEYFAGQRVTFDLPYDWRLASGFRRQVLQRLARVDFGVTLSYGQLAAAVGNPRAVRATGTACATNPLPVVVPCHRVIRADGSLGNYGGGVEVKQTLLELEQGRLFDQ